MECGKRGGISEIPHYLSRMRFGSASVQSRPIHGRGGVPAGLVIQPSPSVAVSGHQILLDSFQRVPLAFTHS